MSKLWIIAAIAGMMFLWNSFRVAGAAEVDCGAIDTSYKLALDRCLAKLPRMDETHVTEEARMTFMFHCAYQAGVWKRRDP